MTLHQLLEPLATTRPDPRHEGMIFEVCASTIVDEGVDDAHD
jgi:hypothetical protein